MSKAMAKRKIKLAPVHPGEILSKDFMQPLELSIKALSRALRVPPHHVSGIVNRKRGITALMALRLARYFGTSAELWLGLQQDYELDVPRDKAAVRIRREVLPRAS
jgi:addiction module HigA family antidote